MAHKTWLVALAAYDSGREKTADKIDQLFVDGSQFVNDLLEKGESVETQIQEKLEARSMLKNKIAALKAKLGFGSENRDQQIDMLTQRVDSLIDVVAKLAQQKAAEQSAPAKKAPAKKAPAKPAAKPAAKATTTKAPAKTAAKPAAKATTTKAPAKTAAKPTTKAKATKTPAKTAAKPASKATASKAPVKTAAKTATNATATKNTVKPADTPTNEAED